MKVKDIGMKEVHCASPTMNLGEVASMMKRHNIGVVPVCEGNQQLLGILTDRDLVVSCMAADLDPRACKVRDYMTANPITVMPDTELEEAARIMGREQIRRLPVVDAGKMVGIVSLGDISTAFAQNDQLVAETLRKISTPTHAIAS